MADFKGMGPNSAPRTIVDESLIMEPLFAGELDLETQGGLVVLPGGVADLRHPEWVSPGQSKKPEDRIHPLPVHYQAASNGTGDTLTWVGGSEHGWNPTAPTLGAEIEIEVRFNGERYVITEDGVTLLYPKGGTEPLADTELDPEAFKQMVELKTEVAAGWEEHRIHFITALAKAERWLAKHNLESPHLSVLPDASSRSDVTAHPWTDGVIGDKMRSITEFNCISQQQHIQLASVEAGIHALTKYQGVQALFGLLTASAPIRDGSFETTLAQHYNDEHRTNTGERVLSTDDLIYRDGRANTPPYDWRELARVLGSQSAGAFAEVVPADLKAFLKEGDRKMRDGATVSAVRTFGWHTDRLRLDKGTVEICNLGTAGGNVHKSLAVQEAVGKYVVALQQEYVQEANASNWQAQYEHAVEAGQTNNYFAGLDGKGTRFIGENGMPTTPANMLASVKAFIDAYSPVPLSDEAYAELQATLEEAPSASEFATAEEVFTAFFRPGSKMTATDALHIAHEVAPDMPVGELLSLYADARRDHIFIECQRVVWQKALRHKIGALAAA